MITGDYILYVTVYHKETNEDIGKGNVSLSQVLVDTAKDFYDLAESTIKKDFGSNASIRIVGIYKL